MDVLENVRDKTVGEAVHLEGVVRGLETARALVVFLRSRSEGRLTSLEEHIAAGLEVRGFATVHVNLLSKQEQDADDRTGCHHLDREFHRRRAAALLGWVDSNPALRLLPLGIFADGAAAAAALEAAALPGQVRAVVCLDGRVDLAEPDYGDIRADTLLLVAEGNTHIADLNRRAQLHIAGARLEVVPHATHRYDDTRGITYVAWRTVEWFSTLCG